MCKKCRFYGQLDSATCNTLTHQQVGVMCPEVTLKNTSSEFEAKHDFGFWNQLDFILLFQYKKGQATSQKSLKNMSPRIMTMLSVYYR